MWQQLMQLLLIYNNKKSNLIKHMLSTFEPENRHLDKLTEPRLIKRCAYKKKNVYVSHFLPIRFLAPVYSLSHTKIVRFLPLPVLLRITQQYSLLHRRVLCNHRACFPHWRRTMEQIWDTDICFVSEIRMSVDLSSHRAFVVVDLSSVSSHTQIQSSKCASPIIHHFYFLFIIFLKCSQAIYNIPFFIICSFLLIPARLGVIPESLVTHMYRIALYSSLHCYFSNFSVL